MSGWQLLMFAWVLDAGTYQKRLAECRLLGELYNYMLLDSRWAGQAALPVLQRGRGVTTIVPLLCCAHMC